MRKIGFMMICAVLPAAAQWRHFGSEPARATGYFGVGVSTPVNPLARSLDTGWNLSGGVGVTSRYVGVLVDATFNDFGLNHRTLAQAGVPRGNQKYWAITVDPVFHVNERGPVDFYVTGGGGVYSQITDYRLPYGVVGPFSGGSDLLASNTIFKPGVDGGAGFAFNAGYATHLKIFIEARFHHMFTHRPGSSFIPVTIGVRF